MQAWRIVAGIGGGVIGLALLSVGWAYASARSTYATTWDVQGIASAPTGSVERGRELVTTRLGCHECHGADFGGGVVMDVVPVGRLSGPNLTTLPEDYTIAQFDLIVRHGVRRDGTTAMMPAIDYEGLSDAELADVFAYTRSFPEVERDLAPSHLGPVLWFLTATGSSRPAAFLIDHDKVRPAQPPPVESTLEYGEHLAKVCRGCHRMDYSGGPIEAGNPDWPPASNLTPHRTGLAGWTKQDFRRAMREGISKDGTTIDPSMPWRSMGQMADQELDAMFAYFASLPPATTGR